MVFPTGAAGLLQPARWGSKPCWYLPFSSVNPVCVCVSDTSSPGYDRVCLIFSQLRQTGQQADIQFGDARSNSDVCMLLHFQRHTGVSCCVRTYNSIRARVVRLLSCIFLAPKCVDTGTVALPLYAGMCAAFMHACTTPNCTTPNSPSPSAEGFQLAVEQPPPPLLLLVQSLWCAENACVSLPHPPPFSHTVHSSSAVKCASVPTSGLQSFG